MRDLGREVLTYPRRRADGSPLILFGRRRQWLPAFFCATLLPCYAITARAGSTAGTFDKGTSINSGQPNNNSGGASLIYLGQDAENGHIRGLIHFNLPSSLNARDLITGATLNMTTSSLAFGPPTAATVNVYRITENWGQGNGAGMDPISGDYTYGSACTVGGATWNQPFCAGTPWASAGGSIAGLSASATMPGIGGASVQWNSAGLASDVQYWVDGNNNYGWLLYSSTEVTAGSVQAFTKNPQLNLSYACKSAFLDTGSGCTTCTAAAQTACVTAESGNTCNDSGPPSTTYSCTCGNAAYTADPTGTSCIDKNECVPNHCTDLGDTQAMCTDHVAPATGYDCTCDAGFAAIAGTCSDDIFGNGFE